MENEKPKFIKKFRCPNCGNLLGGILENGWIGNMKETMYYTDYTPNEPLAIFVCNSKKKGNKCNGKLEIKLSEIKINKKNN